LEKKKKPGKKRREKENFSLSRPYLEKGKKKASLKKKKHAPKRREKRSHVLEDRRGKKKGRRGGVTCGGKENAPGEMRGEEE